MASLLHTSIAHTLALAAFEPIETRELRNSMLKYRQRSSSTILYDAISHDRVSSIHTNVSALARLTSHA